MTERWRGKVSVYCKVPGGDGVREVNAVEMSEREERLIALGEWAEQWGIVALRDANSFGGRHLTKQALEALPKETK